MYAFSRRKQYYSTHAVYLESFYQNNEKEVLGQWHVLLENQLKLGDFKTDDDDDKNNWRE